MRVGQDYFKEKSSFLSLEKDFSIIANKLLNNDNLCKMLYYDQPDCLKAKKLTDEEKLSLINHQIKILPLITIENNCPNQVIINMTDFTPNPTNPEFRDCKIIFNILCHPDHWNMGNFALRPYKIAGEIDGMLADQKLTGIGTLQFFGCDNLVLNGELMGVQLGYKAIHGIEDSVNPLS